MDKKVYDVSFSDIVNNLGKRVSRNDDLALLNSMITIIRR